MRRICLAITTLALTGVLLTCGVAGAQELKDIEEAYLKIVRKVRPSVVSVTVSKTVTERRKEAVVTHVSSMQFSGMVISKEGHIVTVARGITGTTEISVEMLDGKQRRAELVGTDKQSNVGIIKIKDAEGLELTPVEFGDSGKLRVGSLIVVVGCPSGLKHSVVYGNVSGLNRTLVSALTYYPGMIQLSSPVSHSDPGGLVANSEGKLVGMVSPAFIKMPSFRRVEEVIDAVRRKLTEIGMTASKKEEDKPGQKEETPSAGDREKVPTPESLPQGLYDPTLSQGINFAIPGSAVKRACERIIQKKPTPWVGVVVRELEPAEKAQLKLQEGLVVLKVVKDSPAGRAELQERDIILRAGSKRADSVETFINAIWKTGVDGELSLSIFRKLKEVEVKIKLEERK